MALIKCKECGNDVSSKALTCPKCGIRIARKPMGCGTAIGILAIIFIAIPAFLSGVMSGSARTSIPTAQKPAETPEDTAKRKKDDAAIQRATAGAITLKKSMRDPDSFKLESALVIEGTGAVCYEYRAKNGFGGTNVGQAVLASDGKNFRSSTMDGFSRLWNKECAGKKGTDAATAIRWFAL
jgi:hypothetical protein